MTRGPSPMDKYMRSCDKDGKGRYPNGLFFSEKTLSSRDLAHVSEALANSHLFSNKERTDRSRPAQTATIMYYDEGTCEFTQASDSSPTYKGQLFINRWTGLYRRQTGKPTMSRRGGIQPMTRSYCSTNLRFCTTIVLHWNGPWLPRT